MAPATLLATATLALANGCGDDRPDGAARAGSPEASSGAPQPPAQARRDAARHPRVEPVPCPAGLAGCRSARGAILYVERVDPDGDGDAHFVLASEESITLPGISVVDVSADLRPRPLPGPGDELAAAGPVQTGSAGQSQIHAVEVRTATAAGSSSPAP